MLSEPSAPAAKNGDWEILVQREYPKVVSIASKIVGLEEARDVAQDVFAECLTRQLEVTPGRLYLAATHRALNALRGRRRRTQRELSAFRLHISLRSHAPDPAELIERHDECVRARAAMATLADPEAQILALRYGGLKYREIADALGVNVNQIGTRLIRAERAFRREIERVTP